MSEPDSDQDQIIGKFADHPAPQDFFGTDTVIISDKLGPRYERDTFALSKTMHGVYKGWDRRLGIPVCIKEIATTNKELSLEDKAEFLATLEEEAEFLATLNHKHIIKILNLVKEEDKVAYVMRYFDPEVSPTLSTKSRSGNVTPKEVAKITTEVASALDYLHKQEGERMGKIHRDVKDENIIIDPNFGAVLIDYGIVISKEETSETGTAFGTILYMSPESLSINKVVDERTDVWGLGVTAFHALTGKFPFGTAEERDFMINRNLVLESEPVLSPLENIDPNLIPVFEKAFQKDPDNRYQTPGEFANALNEVIGS